MARLISHARGGANRKRTLAQAAALAAAIAAGGAVAANFIGNDAGQASQPLEVRELNPAKFAPAETAQARADLDGIASRMILVSNSPRIVVPEKIGEAATPVIPAASVRDHVRFLGVVSDGSGFFALIAVDGKQRIVAVGDVIRLAGETTATVTEITADSISLDDGKKIEKIELANRSGSVVSQAAAATVPPPVTAASGARPSQDPRVRTGRNYVKDPYAGLDPRARAQLEQTNAKAAQAATDARELRRKARRIELEQETGRTGEEIEKLLEEMDQKQAVQDKLGGAPGKGGK